MRSHSWDELEVFPAHPNGNWIAALGTLRRRATRPEKRRHEAKPDRQQSAGPVRVEAPGIEPGSRGTSVPASTCVACLLLEHALRLFRVRWTGLQQARFRFSYRPGFFSRNGRRVGPGGCPRSSGSREPELASRPQPLRRRVRSGSRVFTPRERTAVQQLKCDRLFTWPTDQPRHATEHFRYPVDTNSPPVLDHLIRGGEVIIRFASEEKELR
jgi:hypothetical protein